MDKIQIGLNAGAIWNTMDADHDKHVWDVEELQQATGLSVPDFYAALGWLARENKVDFGEDGITHHGTVGLVVEFYHFLCSSSAASLSVRRDTGSVSRLC